MPAVRFAAIRGVPIRGWPKIITSAGRIFGGEPVRPLLGDFGWQAYGMETVPPIVMRGVSKLLPKAKRPAGFAIWDDDLPVL